MPHAGGSAVPVYAFAPPFTRSAKRLFVFRRNANITATRAQPGRRPVYEDTGVSWAEAVDIGAV